MNVDALYRLVGERICEARKRVGVSQAKLAKQLDMSRTSIVNIEAGRQRAPLHVLWLIAERLKTELGLLIPKESEYRDEIAPVSLDSATIAQIEQVANGDPVTKRDLTAFISKAKSKAT
ncbi:MAG: helix-turn-helix domain-containing protein [Candidatus Thiodiazotropha endolucinida]|nr:helix-turn-helix domain-containing protein [Candidatus Thiodiazotropha taylori]MCG8060549.1 helix-turn-helix domain-containing protein [Candidatus Thiodiazotropha taylori]MCW4345233.1 helix-turn-helix domain-containing protein [Candidatus Thiodiazotropha endolucinida]MCW4349676.1 helix-turn-helix domain-containing protein [Candidatus Thiodiazotropha endolucinida]